MSKQFDDTNRGALFKEQEKSSERAPDYKGSINVDGKDYWLSAWVKEAQSGRKYMSLSVEPKEKQAPRQQPTGRGKPSRDFDDAPF